MRSCFAGWFFRCFICRRIRKPCCEILLLKCHSVGHFKVQGEITMTKEMERAKIILGFLRRHRRVLCVLMDVFLLALAFAVVCFFHGYRSPEHWLNALIVWILCTVLISGCLRLLHTNRNLWRYAGAKEYLAFIYSYGLGYLIFFLLNRLLFKLDVSGLLVLTATMAGLILSLYARTVYRALLIQYQEKYARKNKTRYLAIIGAGNAGIALCEEIMRDAQSSYTVWGFFDDDKSKTGMNIHGVPVRGTIDHIPDIIPNSSVYEMVLCIPTLPLERRTEIVELCNRLHCHLKIMPDTSAMMERSTERMEKFMRPVQIEDLLGRTSVCFSENELDPFLRGKTVLVTGGGGSIGSELSRQIVHVGAARLVIFDINENDSYMLYRELKPVLPGTCRILIEIGSMTDKTRVEDVFRKYKPDVVFHAASHKHVPLMEYCPYEAVFNNIYGTYLVLQATAEAKCGKFVLISSDKAVNPTNIMGATKRYCENMLRAFSTAPKNETVFVSVRFGNVLGSHGSVVPLFQMQIGQGGPVTITDCRMTRYFMTIPEAAGLVLRAGAMARSAETYILDMGAPVRIVDLAENLIRLSGFTPYKDIEIVESGLRPGEKLFEELLVNDDRHSATSNAKIFVEKNETSLDMDELREQLKELDEAVKSADSWKVVRLMRQFVPRFMSPEEVNGALGAKDIKLDELLWAQ